MGGDQISRVHKILAHPARHGRDNLGKLHVQTRVALGCLSLQELGVCHKKLGLAGLVRLFRNRVALEKPARAQGVFLGEFYFRLNRLDVRLGGGKSGGVGTAVYPEKHVALFDIRAFFKFDGIEIAAHARADFNILVRADFRGIRGVFFEIADNRTRHDDLRRKLRRVLRGLLFFSATR